MPFRFPEGFELFDQHTDIQKGLFRHFHGSSDFEMLIPPLYGGDLPAHPPDIRFDGFSGPLTASAGHCGLLLSKSLSFSVNRSL